MPITPRTVLIAEDAAVTRALIRRSLKGLPIDFIEAVSARAAIRAINTSRPDLILLDICLPGLDGLSLLQRIRKDEALRTLPVIMITVEGGRECRETAAQLGAIAYIVKPFNPMELRNTVETSLWPRGVSAP